MLSPHAVEFAPISCSQYENDEDGMNAKESSVVSATKVKKTKDERSKPRKRNRSKKVITIAPIPEDGVVDFNLIDALGGITVDEGSLNNTEIYIPNAQYNLFSTVRDTISQNVNEGSFSNDIDGLRTRGVEDVGGNELWAEDIGKCLFPELCIPHVTKLLLFIM